MIAAIAKLLRKYRGPAPSFRFILRATKLFPRSPGILKEFCINRIAVRDFDAVIGRCSEAASDRKNGDAFKDAASAYLVRACIEDDASPETLASLRSGFRKKGAACDAHFKAGDFRTSRDDFSEALRLARVTRKSVSDWLGAFDAVAAIGSGPDPLVAAPPPTPRPVRKLVVSGMYWSGSGALYDFLREFDQVTAIPGELRLWKEGDFCLHALASRPLDRDGLKETLFRFLTIALVGTGPILNWREEMAARYALASSRSPGSAEYARVCRRFAEESAACVRSNGLEQTAFGETAARLADGLCAYWSGGSPKTALLDNVVHIGGIDAVRLFGDATVLCSFRDPRSNFVARWYENPRFNRDVDRYIDYYRITMERFNAVMAESPELAARVYPIRFESFILSDEYRDKTASECGLDLGSRKKGRYFRPNASKRNIANYLDFPDQNVIRRIERELSAYCVEPSIP